MSTSKLFMILVCGALGFYAGSNVTQTIEGGAIGIMIGLVLAFFILNIGKILVWGIGLGLLVLVGYAIVSFWPPQPPIQQIDSYTLSALVIVSTKSCQNGLRDGNPISQKEMSKKTNGPIQAS